MTELTRRHYLGGSIGAALALGASGIGIAGENNQPTSQPTEETPVKPAPSPEEEAQASPEETLLVSFIQIDSEGSDLEANLKKADQYFRWAAERGSDIALLPEMFSIGYNGYYEGGEEAKKKWQSQAVPRDGEWVQHFAKLAKELSMAIGVTYLEEWPGAPRNSLTIFDRHGKELLTYAKIHTCDFAAFEAATTPGDDFHVAELDTAKGPVSTGAMICYDREFPEAARTLMLKGAELVLVPNACTLDDLRIAQFQVRAHENSVMMCMTNYPEPKYTMNGRSVAFDVAGNPIAEAPAEAGIYTAPFVMPAMRSYRERTIWGNSFRRPHRYGALTEFYDLPVFRRKNGFGEDFDPRKR
jgi:predicted amidohydrolase